MLTAGRGQNIFILKLIEFIRFSWGNPDLQYLTCYVGLVIKMAYFNRHEADTVFVGGQILFITSSMAHFKCSSSRCVIFSPYMTGPTNIQPFLVKAHTHTHKHTHTHTHACTHAHTHTHTYTHTHTHIHTHTSFPRRAR